MFIKKLRGSKFHLGTQAAETFNRVMDLNFGNNVLDTGGNISIINRSDVCNR